MTQYMLAVHHSPDAPPPPPELMQQAFKQVDAFNAEIQAAGQWVFGGGLESPEIATVVNATEGDTVITDGPFAETKEALAGFYLVDASDLDEAIQIASKIPPAREGTIEVRPVRELAP